MIKILFTKLLIILFLAGFGLVQCMSGIKREFKNIVHEKSGKCVDVNVRMDGLMLFDCNGDESQLWAYCPESGSILSKLPNDRCILYDGDVGVLYGRCNKKATWEVSERKSTFKARWRNEICLENSGNKNINFNKLIASPCLSDGHKLLGGQRWRMMKPRDTSTGDSGHDNDESNNNDSSSNTSKTKNKDNNDNNNDDDNSNDPQNNNNSEQKTQNNNNNNSDEPLAGLESRSLASSEISSVSSTSSVDAGSQQSTVKKSVTPNNNEDSDWAPVT